MDDKTMRIVVVNCQSLREKNVELLHLINSTNPNIIVGTESWLNTNHKTSEYINPGEYNTQRG